jgi:hypothetical protein
VFDYLGLGAESWEWEKLYLRGIEESNAKWLNFTAHRLRERDTTMLNRDPLPCREHFERTGEDLWYYESAHGESEFHAPMARNNRRAKELCFSCPVREKCLQDAIERSDDHGIWGGLTVNERRRLRRELKARAAA